MAGLLEVLLPVVEKVAENLTGTQWLAARLHPTAPAGQVADGVAPQ